MKFCEHFSDYYILGKTIGLYIYLGPAFDFAFISLGNKKKRAKLIPAPYAIAYFMKWPKE